MILSGQSILQTPRWLRAFVLTAAAVAVPLGFTLAQESDDLSRVQEWLQSGVNSAYLTQEQADIMLRALQENALRMSFVTQDGNVVNLNRALVAPGVALDPEARRERLREAIAVTEHDLAERVASGDMSQEEADAILERMSRAMTELSNADGTAAYFNVGALAEGHRVFGVSAVPVAPDAASGETRAIRVIRSSEGGEEGVDFHVFEPLQFPVGLDAERVEVIRNDDGTVEAQVAAPAKLQAAGAVIRVGENE